MFTQFFSLFLSLSRAVVLFRQHQRHLYHYTLVTAWWYDIRVRRWHTHYHSLTRSLSRIHIARTKQNFSSCFRRSHLRIQWPTIVSLGMRIWAGSSISDQFLCSYINYIIFLLLHAFETIPRIMRNHKTSKPTSAAFSFFFPFHSAALSFDEKNAW